MIMLFNRGKTMYNVNVYQTAAMMAVTDCVRILSWEELFSDNEDLNEKIGEEKFLYIFQYGMVGFFDPSKDRKNGICNELRQLYNEFQISHSPQSLNLVVHKNISDDSFNKVTLPYLDSVALKKVLHTIVQSVTMNKYAKITNQLWAITTAQNTYLRANGKLKITKRQLKIHLGSLWNIKTEIEENKNVLDTIQDIHESTGSSGKSTELRKAFGLNGSLRQTNERLAIIQENLEFFKAILDQKESSRLEWIIILLIAIEIVDLFVLRFLKWLQ
ncbi:RMD1 family protein [Maribacter halichondriae]|uniref:RMD1 family protein n=1 Tax=Maribacter halichondriae TaxID=2980554 RepID=UPI00235A43B1|nr:RMD1 family protein [Maribacter sp. Hal144]